MLSSTSCHSQIDFGAGFRIDFQRPFSLTAESAWPRTALASPFGASSRSEADDVSLAPFDLTLTSLFIGTDEFSLGGRLAYWLRDDTALLSEQSDTETLAIDLNAAYQFANGPLTFTPGGRLMYSLADDPALATASDSLSLDSTLSALTLSLGGHVSYELNQNWGLLLPFAGFQWTHAFESSDSLSGYRLIPDITGQPLRLQSTPSLPDAQDQDYFNLGVGFSAQFNNGAAAFLNYQKLLGHDELDNYRFKAGLRFDF
ncbi:MAG: autotransporter outer membrane beta-barrel domain-containing protein [Gammaproteobacteria bacterium]